MASDKYVSPYSGEQIDRAYEMVEQIATDIAQNHNKVVYIDNDGLLHAASFNYNQVALVADAWAQVSEGKFLTKGSSGDVTASSYSRSDFLFKYTTDSTGFDTEPTASSTKPVTSGGVYTALQNVREIAEGKTNNYVIDDQVTGADIVNSSFNDNMHLSIEIPFNNNTKIRTVMLDSDNNPIDILLKNLKVGDIIPVIQNNVPDWWVGAINTSTHKITFYTLEIKLNTTDVVAEGVAALITSGGVYTYVSTNYQPKGNYLTVSDAADTYVPKSAHTNTINSQSTNTQWADAAAIYSAITDGNVGTFQTWTFTVKNNDGTTSDVNVKLRTFPITNS